MKYTLKNIGNNIAKIRIKLNLSAREMSLRLGKDPSYWNKVENGNINISLMSFFEICELLNIDPIRLLK